MTRKWYKRKRTWLLVGLVLVFIFSRSELAKMRYDQGDLLNRLSEKTSLPILFDARDFQGKSVNYISVGQRNHLPLIVFVHGSPGAVNAYEEYLSDASLLQAADLIAVDRLGFGYSAFGEAESALEAQAGAIAAITQQFPNRKIILVGHSMGGPVIARYAMDFPTLAQALLMVAPSISPELEPSNSWRSFLNMPPLRWFTPAALRVCNQEIIPLKKELEDMLPTWSTVDIPLTVVQGEMDQLVPMGNAFFAEKIDRKSVV